MAQSAPTGEGGRSSPTSGAALATEREGRLIERCPRCSARIEGEYRYCPSCAYRLRPGPEDPLPPPPPVSLWKKGFLVATGAALVLACLLVGVLLFYPGLFEHRPAANPAPDRAETTTLATPVITVADIPGSLVDLPPDRLAMAYPLDAIPNLKAEDREKILRADPTAESVNGRIWYDLRVMRTEVTRGMYEEFLKDLWARREHVPMAWREARPVGMKILAPEEVDLYARTPEPWIQRDAAGDPVSWAVAPADRNLPVTNVSYVDAQGFAQWAKDRLAIDLEIPVHMEWVAAARGGRLKTPDNPPDNPARDWLWPWGPTGLLYACNNLQAFGGLGPLYVHYPYGEGNHGQSPDGLLAMAGNVAEWAADHDIEVSFDLLGEAYVAWKPPVATPATAFAAGGSFRDGLYDCTVDSKRSLPKDGPSARRDDVGFRLVVRGG